MFKAPFSFDGRIRRTEYGISVIIYITALFVIFFGIGMMVAVSESEMPFALLFLAMIPVGWFILAQGAKRCHDVGNSGWFQIIPFYRLYLLFGDGQPGANEYGVNPKEDQGYDF